MSGRRGGLTISRVFIAAMAAAAILSSVTVAGAQESPVTSVDLDSDEVVAGHTLTAEVRTEACFSEAQLFLGDSVETPPHEMTEIGPGMTVVAELPAGIRTDIEIPAPTPPGRDPASYFLGILCDDGLAAFTPFSVVPEPGDAARPGAEEPEPSLQDDGGDPDNRAPVATDDDYATPAGRPLTVDAPGVLANDTDPDGDELIAVIQGRSATTGAIVRFRPTGGLEVTAEEPGHLCVEYVARDDRGAPSDPAVVVVDIGDADDRDEVVGDDGRCRNLVSEHAYAFEVADGTGGLSDELLSSGGAAATGDSLSLPESSSDGAVTLVDAGAAFAEGGGPTAVPIPLAQGGVEPQLAQQGRRCTVSTCLFGFFGPPYITCNNSVHLTNFGHSRYGSMTAYGYLRKGLADYARVRGIYYQDGQLLRVGPWQYKRFPGGNHTAWISLKIHMQFGSPSSRYLVGYQAQWWQKAGWFNVGFGDWRWRPDDRHIASTRAWVPIPYYCTAGP